MKKKGLILHHTKEAARNYAINKFSNVEKMTSDGLETEDVAYKYKKYSSDDFRGYRGIEEIHIQYDIPVGAFFEVVRPMLTQNYEVIIFN